MHAAFHSPFFHLDLSILILNFTIYTEGLAFGNSVFNPQCIYVFFCGYQNKQQFLFTVLIFSAYITETECLLRGTGWVFKYDRSSFVLKRLSSVLPHAYMVT